jgi:hypothetical protein
MPTSSSVVTAARVCIASLRKALAMRRRLRAVIIVHWFRTLRATETKARLLGSEECRLLGALTSRMPPTWHQGPLSSEEQTCWQVRSLGRS